MAKAVACKQYAALRPSMMMQQEADALFDAAQHTDLDDMNQLLCKGCDPDGNIGAEVQ